MLANPVVIPAYADPIIWVVALVAMWAEIGTEVAMLRRQTATIGLARTLLLINIMTWLAFLMAVDSLARHGSRLGWGIAGLEVVVVVSESILLWTVLRSGSRGRQHPPLGLLRVMWVALVGNLVSIAISMAPVALLWLLH